MSMRLNCVLFNRAANPPTESTMGKYLHRAFRDLLSLHGYPLPFESIERITGTTETPDYRRGYGNRAASVQAFPRAGRAADPCVRAPRVPC